MNFLFKPVDIASLVFFRVVFGILGFADVLGVWTYYHLYKGYFQPGQFQFKYVGFEWVQPFPEPFMSLLFIVVLAAAVFIVLGWWYRLAAVVFAAGFCYIFLLEKAVYLNHGYLFCWICWIMVFLPANHQWSGDVLRNPSLQSDQIERWSLWILPFLMGVVYFYGGIAKINEDWLDANPLKYWLRNSGDMPLIGWVWQQKATAYFMAWSGMLLDLSAPIFLLFRRTRVWALGFILLFHLTNTLIFQIGIFPWLSISLSLLFFSPDFPRRVFAFLKQKFRKLERLENWWDQKLEHPVAISSHPFMQVALPPGFHQKIVVPCLIALVAFHLLMPLRHWYFDGNVAWTEEGHRFSWRMMLRSKRGHGHFEVKNPATGKLIQVEPADYLTDRQVEKIFTHPDMILQFAHYLHDLWQRQGEPGVEVRAIIRVSLNRRKSAPYIDPQVDLAQQQWSLFEESEWIMPFEED